MVVCVLSQCYGASWAGIYKGMAPFIEGSIFTDGFARSSVNGQHHVRISFQQNYVV